MSFDVMKLGYDGNIILDEAPMTLTNSYKYLGHIITDNLSDEANLEDKERGLYSSNFPTPYLASDSNHARFWCSSSD